jgi:hypothetical protein
MVLAHGLFLVSEQMTGRLGHCPTPFGPEWLDRGLARFLGLNGDYIPDFWLFDYLVALMATDESPSLNGCPGNDTRLKADLSDMGVFDPCMPLYMFYRARSFESMGFTGFEGRHYAGSDMSNTVPCPPRLTAMCHRSKQGRATPDRPGLLAGGDDRHDPVPRTSHPRFWGTGVLPGMKQNQGLVGANTTNVSTAPLIYPPNYRVGTSVADQCSRYC